ncbi:MAG: stalk domain-containing protein [Peptococcaceae bacterium]|nr:stalk domain-containing protein [Peptococcaceae bacterium]
MKRKTWLLTAAALALGCWLPTAAMAESTDVELYVNYDEVYASETMGMPFINDNGRTMVPLRVVNENLDYITEWTNDGRIHITGKDGLVDVILQAGSTEYIANGEVGQFDTAPVIRENGRTYLPARDFGELYGKVYWDNEERTVWINDREGPVYAFSGDHMIRYDENSAQVVTMPEKYEVDMTDVQEFVCQQKELDGKQYLIIVYNRNVLMNGELFRDEGDHMIHLGGINCTTDFTVDGNTLYSTMGTSAGHATGVIDPNELYASSIGDGGKSAIYTLDFAVNECALTMEDGNLIATSPDGTRHIIDFSTLTPDEEW